jgi:ABC-type amino acid transport substrate-binding protein
LILLAFFLVAAPLRVFTKPIEPFSFKKDGADAGFSIELWERVAKETGLQYEITWVKTVSDLIEALKDGKADVAIAAISITAEREKVVDFSQPYYESGLQILVSPTPQSSASTLMATLFTWDFAKVIGMLALALLLSSHLLWFFERRHNEENFPRPYRHGVWESLWWTSSGC